MVLCCQMVSVMGDFGVRFPRFRARSCSSDTVFVRVERERLRETVSNCGGTAAALFFWPAWASSAFT